MSAKWDYLFEADDSLRDLERVYISTGSKDDAAAYVRAAKRVHSTQSPVYYGALWASGGRPPSGEITRRAIALQDAYDQLVIDYVRKHNISQTGGAADAIARISYRKDSASSLAWQFATSMHWAIGNSSQLARSHLKTITNYVTTVLNSANRLKASPATVKFLKNSLVAFKALDGQE
jgi:hypothetical protein